MNDMTLTELEVGALLRWRIGEGPAPVVVCNRCKATLTPTKSVDGDVEAIGYRCRPCKRAWEISRKQR